MNSLRFLFSFSCMFLLLVPLANAQFCSDNIGNYTTNSTYHKNLNTLFSSLNSNTEIKYGFYNLSVGQATNQVNAIALCRGDVSLDDCRGCIRNATRKMLQACANKKEALDFFDYCMLRYSNRSIFAVMEDDPTVHMWSIYNASNVDQFNLKLQTLLSRLRSQAASGNSLLKFATGNESAGFETIFGLMQCTPDLTEQQCNDCLIRAIPQIQFCCAGKLGGRVLKPSCNLRFENYRFFEATPDIPTSFPLAPRASAPIPTKGKKSNNVQTVLIIIAIAFASVVIIITSIYIFLRAKNRRGNIETLSRPFSEAVDEIEIVESLHFDLDTVRTATNNFSAENELGQGGFGAVYKGILPNGQDIAVKRLSKFSGQGDLEFKNEVLLVAKLQHRNLVRLLGFCLEGNERLLIYEFMPNASLDQFIFDPIKRELLNWEMRYKIIVGIARGLLYLHEDSRLRIIHRDLKASNILLDADMNPKISDFGMARLFDMDQTQGDTSRIVGTYGYMAPEYAMHGQFSIKSDVFSFGVLVLEILSGEKNNCFQDGENIEDLLSYAWKNWRERTYSNLLDPTIQTGLRNEMVKCIHIGLLCVQENVADRPTMTSVVSELSSQYSLTLPQPSPPLFFMHSRTESDMPNSLGYNSGLTESSTSKTENLPLSINEASISELYPR